MVYRDYIGEFKSYAEKLYQQYERQVAMYSEFPVQKKLWLLDVAIHKLENELNGHMAYMHTQAEQGGYLTLQGMDEQMVRIKKETLKDFLAKQLDAMNQNKETAKVTINK